jgi:hypothetical protein
MTAQAAFIDIVVIMGLLSSLFGCTSKPDPDEVVIIQLRKRIGSFQAAHH